MAVQNNFNSMNGGDFTDRQIDNTPPSPRKEEMLSKPINQSATEKRSTGTFNSKVVTS